MKTRRRFLNGILAGGFVGWLGTILYPVLSFLKPPKGVGPAVGSVNAGPASDVAPNSGRIVRFGRKPVILIRTEAGEIRAFSAVCTHLECTVQYREDLRHIWCACHNGHYDRTGRNIAGPPPRPLAPYDVTVSEGDLIVSARAE
jgi:Rieske Fe-S protein